MKRAIVALGLCAILVVGWSGGTKCQAQATLVQQAPKDQGRRFFPRNFVRGFVDFEVTPPHNEIDMGLCSLATNNTDFVRHPTCTAYARYAWSGYLELQPVGRGQLRRLFFYLEPKFYGGENLPQQNYTASGSLILWERSVGVGVELPDGFEVRIKNHQVNLLGRYTKAGGTATLRTDGPYGQYTTVGVRWNFGGWGGAGGHGTQ
jgi:hypothetical protein